MNPQVGVVVETNLLAERQFDYFVGLVGLVGLVGFENHHS